MEKISKSKLSEIIINNFSGLINDLDTVLHDSFDEITDLKRRVVELEIRNSYLENQVIEAKVR